MLNEERVILMTKMASYEEGEGKKSMSLGRYFRETTFPCSFCVPFSAAQLPICWDSGCMCCMILRL